MYNHLKTLRVVEGASFIAAPSCGLHLAQLGAEVIRFDQVGGGPDFHRWPRIPGGPSLYWEGLNKGKKSIALDLTRPEGRELAMRLATAPGENGGIFLTNYPVDGFLSHEQLSAIRPDLITVRVMGWPDGTPALDYTVNCAIGIPDMTGPSSVHGPVNHVLPAWDLLTGAYAAFSLLAAERRRRETGQGEEVRVPLGDVAMATLGNLGQVAEVLIGGNDRPRTGNDLFGAFGRDFVTRDGRRLMIVAITARQWKGLVRALDIQEQISRLEVELGLSFAMDEGLRFEHRDRLNPIVATAVACRNSDELTGAFDAAGVCWGPYRTLKAALEQDERLSPRNPVFSEVQHPSGHRYLTPGYAATMSGHSRQAPASAPRLGEHTEQVLAEVLRLTDGEIADLHDRRIVASPAE